jgi:hypothetical protein
LMEKPSFTLRRSGDGDDDDFPINGDSGVAWSALPKIGEDFRHLCVW